VKLIDANWIWTEPHSRRLKIKLTVQKEVFNNAVLQQTFVVEFTVANQQCTDCQKSYTEHTWESVVQVRQKVKHKRTFFWLEQLMIKHNVCAKCINIRDQPDGLDFYYSSKSLGQHMVHFLESVIPIRSQFSKKLITQVRNSPVEKMVLEHIVRFWVVP
jgi:nonsense-mediated mRNA decay protein 3